MQEDITKALEVLQNGGTILYPTDTIWGIGCDATNSKAISKIYKIKYRQQNKLLTIMANSVEMIANYVEDVPDIALELIESYKEPITIVYDKARNLPKNLVPDDGSIGIRIPKSEFCLELIRQLGKPISSTSANISGDSEPLSFSKINPEIKDAVDYICTTNKMYFYSSKPSTVLKVTTDGQMQIIRS